jgi:hypothetical protein
LIYLGGLRVENHVSGCKISLEQEEKERPNLSVLALTFFVLSFVIARTFTTIRPDAVLAIESLHVHHFWFGLIMLAVGGWLGITYNDVRIDRLAAVLFGAGGGLIGDEIALLLTLDSGSYWAGITYTFVMIFVTFASILILIARYHRIIRTEFLEFVRSNSSIYIGVFFTLVSIAFIVETDNVIILTSSTVIAIASCIVIGAVLVHRLTMKR